VIAVLVATRNIAVTKGTSSQLSGNLAVTPSP